VFALVVVALLTQMAVGMVTAAWQQSPTTDEPVYVGNEDAPVGLADIAELYALFAQVTDPRCPRGVRHHIATVLTAMVLAVLAAVRNFREAGDRAADQPLVPVAGRLCPP
jgi:hypothetical protein